MLRQSLKMLPISKTSFISTNIFHLLLYVSHNVNLNGGSVFRYTQPPGDFWEWYKPYLDDDEVRINEHMHK